MKLRPYQLEAVTAAEAALREKPSALIVLPTGCGKTVVFSHIAHRQEKRVLVLAHRRELIFQAASKILSITGDEAGIEMADQRSGHSLWRKQHVVIASKDTLTGRRLEAFDPSEFGLIITDEAHHAVADSYQEIYDHFKGVPHLGVTATPDRADESALGRIFESVAFVYELPDAIRDGWLCPITQRTVTVQKLDYSQVRTTLGDLNGRDLSEVMANEEILQQVADITIREAKWRKALIFAPPGFKGAGEDSCRVSERLTEVFNRHRVNSARLITGETPDDRRKQDLADFRCGEYQYLINVGVFTEGFDDPSIDMIVMARPTKSRALYSQMVGRGTRPLPGLVDGLATAEERRAAIARSAKPTCEVLDFEGNAGRHCLMHTADILGGNFTEEEVKKAQEIAKESGSAVDMTEAMEEARRRIESAKQEERDRRRQIKGEATYTTESIDPFNILNVAPPVKRGWDNKEPASEAQKGVLNKLKVPVHDGMSKREASALIGACFARRNAGKCSYGQAKLLKARGHSTECTFDEARKLIDGFKVAEGWGNKKVAA